MRTDDAPLIRLEDYRPSDWLIDTVDLDVSLHPQKTRVRALLALRANPQGRSGAPLVLPRGRHHVIEPAYAPAH